jgi:hypothetical protein
MNVLYVSILGKPDHQYLLSVGSTDDEEEGISIGDFLNDRDIEEKRKCNKIMSVHVCALQTKCFTRT